MEYKQAKILKEYIEQLQNEAFERGFKMATKGLSKQMSALEKGQIRHGHWIESDRHDDHYVYCSECGDEYIENDLKLDSWVKTYFKYCPNCGAKMDKEVQDE